MKILLPCWGDKHIDLFDKCLGTTLRWPMNNEAIKGAHWIIPTEDDESYEKIKKIIYDIDLSATVSSLIDKHIRHDSQDALLVALKEAIKLCLKDNEPMLMSTPDYLWSDGSIAAIKAIGEGKGTCVSVAHMRATPEILGDIDLLPRTSAELIEFGMRYSHATWSDSEESANPGRTFNGGISWKKIDSRTMAVRHRLPAPFYANFLESDLDFFSRTYAPPFDLLAFALWDHLFPSHLLQEGRLRYIGSSDAACMVEVTESDANVPPINPFGVTNKDDYRNKNFQNEMCKQFVSIFRY